MDVVSKNAEMQENTELVKRLDVKDSPFQVIETKGEFFGAMANYRLTEVYETEAECREALEEFTWNRVVQVMMLLNEKLNELNKEN